MSLTETTKSQIPLFERILIIGVKSEEVLKYLSQNKSDKIDLDTKIKILEEYKSTELKESPSENYRENISIVLLFNFSSVYLKV